MQVFITGTDTDVGKTLISAWLCLHTKYKYFKPIQTGYLTDMDFMSLFIGKENIYKERYLYKHAVAPYLAASLCNEEINIKNICLPDTPNLIVEGAGGLMVPINKSFLMVDLIKYLNLPVIIIARTKLGTINHTLLSIQLLRMYNINCLGVILNGEPNEGNKKAIEYYGHISVLAELPFIEKVDKNSLSAISLNKKLKDLLIPNGYKT